MDLLRGLFTPALTRWIAVLTRFRPAMIMAVLALPCTSSIRADLPGLAQVSLSDSQIYAPQYSSATSVSGKKVKQLAQAPPAVVSAPWHQTASSEMSRLVPEAPDETLYDEGPSPAQGTYGYGPRGSIEPYCDACPEPWSWQLLPEGIIYRAYLASRKESRMSTYIVDDKAEGPIWDTVLGGRVGLLRYGDHNAFHPEGFQIDLEGSGQPRLDPDENNDLVSADFRVGVPFTYRQGRFEHKLAYYHLSSHVGDEYLVRNPGFERVNYSRDVLEWGLAYRPALDWRIYGQAGWAFHSDIAEPWEFQFGVDYAPGAPTGFRGAPFAAFNVHLREEVDFGGNFVFETGWAWRGSGTGKLLRIGLEYYNGKSPQFEFFDQNEQQIGGAIWLDF
jgi:hypothetical protein